MNEFFDQLLEASGGSEASHPPLQIVARLTAALIIGWVLGFVYKRTHTGSKFSPGIPHAQMLLVVGGALIWLVVGDNLVRAFGLAGTIGLIRYRTRIRDPKDTPVLLFSMVLGMACGLGQYVVASIGLVFVVITLCWLYYSDRWTRAGWESSSEALQQLIDVGKKGKGKDP